jgi:hypothetical protein
MPENANGQEAVLAAAVLTCSDDDQSAYSDRRTDNQDLIEQDDWSNPELVWDPEDLVQAINDEHQAALSAARLALKHAAECGELLLIAQTQITGNWGDWVDANLSFGQRQAQKYMRFHRAVSVKPELLNSHSTLDSALSAIARPKPERSRPPEARQAAVDVVKKVIRELREGSPEALAAIKNRIENNRSERRRPDLTEGLSALRTEAGKLYGTQSESRKKFEEIIANREYLRPGDVRNAVHELRLMICRAADIADRLEAPPEIVAKTINPAPLLIDAAPQPGAILEPPAPRVRVAAPTATKTTNFAVLPPPKINEPDEVVELRDWAQTVDRDQLVKHVVAAGCSRTQLEDFLAGKLGSYHLRRAIEDMQEERP